MKRTIPLHIWEKINNNPLLYKGALLANEAPGIFPWHTHATSERSSQVFCVSAFGTLRHLKDKKRILHQFLTSIFPDFQTASKLPRDWKIELEHEDHSLLGEHGQSQGTSIDVLCSSSQEVLCIESKYDVDADEGFGKCSQYHSTKEHKCHGYYGPGSDKKSNAWCRLEIWERKRSPRLYWLLSKQYFQPGVFREQSSSEICPFRDGNYQLMRNFLTAAQFAVKRKKKRFGVLVISPDQRKGKLISQLNHFKDSVLLPQYSGRVQFASYEQYVSCLNNNGSTEAQELAKHLMAGLERLGGNARD